MKIRESMLWHVGSKDTDAYVVADSPEDAIAAWRQKDLEHDHGPDFVPIPAVVKREYFVLVVDGAGR